MGLPQAEKRNGPAATAEAPPPRVYQPQGSRPIEEVYAAWRAGQGSATTASPQGTVDVMALVRALQRRLLLALVCGLTAAAAALAGAWQLVPQQYTATASLQIAATKPTLLVQQRDTRYDFPTFMKTQAARIKNRDVLLKAVSDDKVRNLQIIQRFPETLTTLQWLDEELKVDYVDGAEFLTISLNNEDPDQAVALVNAIARAYLDLVQGKEENDRKERVNKMQALAQGAKEKLAEKIAMRQGLYKGLGGADPVTVAQKQNRLTLQLHDAQKQQFEVQYQLEKARLRVAAHQSAKKQLDLADVPDVLVKQQIESDPVIKQSLTLMNTLHKLILRMEAEGHPPHESSLVQARRKHAALRKEVEQEHERMKAEVVAKAQKKMETDHAAMTEALKLEVIPLENQAKKLQERVEALTREAEGYSFSSTKVDLINLEIQQDERKLGVIQDKLKDFQVEEESEQRVTLGQEASWVPNQSKKRLLLLGMAPLAAFGGVVAGIGLLEYQRKRIATADDLVKGLGLRVLGQIPRRQGKVRTLSTSTGGLVARNPEEEAVDSLRAVLLRQATLEGWKTLLICSPGHQEGRTTLASALALSCARAGKRTLLIDADVRAPACHFRHEQALSPGLSEVLMQEVEAKAAVRPTTFHDNLHLLPAGQCDPEVVEELSRDDLRALVAYYRGEFDLVILDSHPTLLATDTLLLGQHVDAALLSTLCERSRQPEVQKLCQQLSNLGIPVAGSVFLGA